MADIAELEAALRKADALAQTGNQQAAADAKRLADEIRQTRNAGVPEGMTLDPISGQYRDAGMRARAHPVNAVQGAMRSAQQGLGFGLGDEVNAALAATSDAYNGRAGWSEAYTSRLADERAILDKFRTDNPGLALGSELAGAVAVPGAAVKGATLPQKIASGARSGGAFGAAYGFGTGEGGLPDRAQNMAIGGAVGAVAGAAAPLAMRGVEKIADKRALGRAATAAAKAAPGDDAMRAEAKTLFEGAKARGVQVKESAFQPLADDIVATVNDFGADPAITPGALSATKRITDLLGKNVDWQDIETARRVASNASRAAKIGSPDRALAGQIAGKVDDFVFNLVDGDLTQGQAANLGKELQQARSLWARIKNSERIGRAIEDADVALRGTERGLVNEFKKLRKDRKFWNGLSKPEQDAVMHVIRGTPAGMVLRTVGKFSFGTGQRSGLIGGTIGSTGAFSLGNAVGGPVGGAVAVGAQQALSRGAEAASDRLALSAATRAQSLARAGGVTRLPAPVRYDALENALSYGSRAAPVGFTR